VQFLVSAGEASGDMYAAGVVEQLSRALPEATFSGCAGPRLQELGVKPVVDASRLAVVGLAEVVGHLPRIYGEFRKLVRHARANVPDAALLTDNPDFNLRLAKHLKRLGVPVYYLVAPQVWAWRSGRVKTIRALVDKLFCLFPFEEQWFRERGVDAAYIGHPLATMVRPCRSRAEFLAKHSLDAGGRLVTLLPGSRAGEAVRHMPVLLEAVKLLKERDARLRFLLATPAGFRTTAALQTFREPIQTLSIQVIENETWDALAYSELALAASGTVTVEAAVLGTPMVTFYKVNPLSWWAGRRLVKVPFLSMVNLIAGRGVVPELMQDEMTPQALAREAGHLLEDDARADAMREELGQLRTALTGDGDPFQRAGRLILQDLARRAAPAEVHGAVVNSVDNLPIDNKVR
jgi:lipid-A-disaccharide synthase